MAGLYRPPAPNHLMTGVIDQVDNPDDPNPRYRVRITDTNHPVGMIIYAWAAPEPYHQAAQNQWEEGDRVIVNNIGGVWSIMRQEPDYAQDQPARRTEIRYSNDESLILDRSSMVLKGATGTTEMAPGGLSIKNQDGTGANRQSLELNAGGFALSAEGIHFSSEASGPGGKATLIASPDTIPPQLANIHRVAVQAPAGAMAPSLEAIPVTGTIRVTPGVANGGGTIQNNHISLTVDLRPFFAFADSLTVANSGLVNISATAQANAPTLTWSAISDTDSSIQVAYSGLNAVYRAGGRPIVLVLSRQSLTLGGPLGAGTVGSLQTGVVMPAGAARTYAIPSPTAAAGTAAVSVGNVYGILAFRNQIAAADLPMLTTRKFLYVENSSPGSNIGQAYRFGPVTVGGSYPYTISATELIAGYTGIQSGAAINRIGISYWRGALYDTGFGAYITGTSDPLIEGIHIVYHGFPLPDGDPPVRHWM